MPITTLLLPLLFLLPGLAFFAGCGRHPHNPATGEPGSTPGMADLLFLSIALSGWIAQTLALAGWFTMPALVLAVTLLSLVVLFRGGLRSGLAGIRRVAGSVARPTVPAVAAALAVLALALLLYRPPAVTMLDGDPVPGLNALGLNLARTGSLPLAETGTGLSGAPEAMRGAAGSGLLYPALIGLLQLAGGPSLVEAAPAIFAALSLLALFGIGRQATGSNWLGALVLVALGLNYPQAWLAHVSVPEAAAQLLVLASTLFFLRSRHGFPGVGAAALCLGAASFCSPALLWLIPPALVLLVALHAAGPAAERRRALLFALGVLPFLAQGWLQAFLLVGDNGLPPLPSGSAHWMIWYLTLPFMVLAVCGLLLMLARPGPTLRLFSGLGPLLALALVSIPVLFRNPGSDAVQPWAVRPFTVALIPAALLVGMLFFHRVLKWLGHPALRLIWCSGLAILLGLNLANLMPMATGRPGQGARTLVEKVAAPLSAGERPFTAVVEPSLGYLGLHTALSGAHGIRSCSLNGDALDRERFHALVQHQAAAGQRTALVVNDGDFFPDPALVTLRPLDAFSLDLRRLPGETDHLPSSVVSRSLHPQIFEAIPVAADETPAHRSPLGVRVGVYAEDWPWLVSGFRGVTEAGGRPHRWTGDRARIRVPAWAGGVELTVCGYRPPGAPPALVSAGFGHGQAVVTRQLPREGFVAIFVPRPGDDPDPQAAYLELNTTCFHPESWFTEKDRTPLGLQLASITYYAAGQSPPASPVGE